MKIIYYFVLSISLFFSHSAVAKIESGYHIFDSKISLNKCVEIAKKARISIFEDQFGEFIHEDGYTYIGDKTTIEVLCIPTKKVIIITVASEGDEMFSVISAFSKYFEPFGKTLNE